MERPSGGDIPGSRGTARPFGPFTTMIGIPVTAAAYEAIKRNAARRRYGATTA
jgi:hypothetical protein